MWRKQTMKKNKSNRTIQTPHSKTNKNKEILSSDFLIFLLIFGSHNRISQASVVSYLLIFISRMNELWKTPSFHTTYLFLPYKTKNAVTFKSCKAAIPNTIPLTTSALARSVPPDGYTYVWQSRTANLALGVGITRFRWDVHSTLFPFIQHRCTLNILLTR